MDACFLPEGKLIRPLREGARARLSSSSNTHLGFFPRFAHARWHHCHPVVAGKVLVGGVEVRLVQVRARHPSLEIVRQQQLRYPAQKRQGSHMRPKPVGQTLAPVRFSIRVAAGAQGGQEYLCSPHLPCFWKDHCHALPRVVDEQLFSSFCVAASSSG